MRDIIKDLRRDHRRFAVLLNILEGETHNIGEGKNADLQLVVGIIEYFSGYPEKCHHPKEDALYERLRERLPEAAKGFTALEEDHRLSAKKIQALKHAVENVIDEVNVSRSAFTRVAMDYIQFQREHMRREETKFLPTMDEFLTNEDWADIALHAMDTEDPLVSGEDERQYEQLRQAIMEWEAENGR